MVHFYKVQGCDASAAAAVPEPCFDKLLSRAIVNYNFLSPKDDFLLLLVMVVARLQLEFLSGRRLTCAF